MKKKKLDRELDTEPTRHDTTGSVTTRLDNFRHAHNTNWTRSRHHDMKVTDLFWRGGWRQLSKIWIMGKSIWMQITWIKINKTINFSTKFSIRFCFWKCSKWSKWCRKTLSKCDSTGASTEPQTWKFEMFTYRSFFKVHLYKWVEHNNDFEKASKHAQLTIMGCFTFRHCDSQSFRQFHAKRCIKSIIGIKFK